jgi:hypothetical protein
VKRKISINFPEENSIQNSPNQKSDTLGSQLSHKYDNSTEVVYNRNVHFENQQNMEQELKMPNFVPKPKQRQVNYSNLVFMKPPDEF